jgi:rhodanese-related sulfurtransferase
MRSHLFSLILILTLGASLQAYDTERADFFHNYYQKLTQQTLSDSKLFLGAEEAVAMLYSDNRPLLLDIRTEAEAAVVGLTYEDSMLIPLDKLFNKEQLDRLPTDRTIILVCYSGTRAAMAATALQMSGITNIRVLKGGVAALAKATTPKSVPLR